MTKELIKDILKGRFDPKIPQLLIYAESDVQGLEIFIVLEEITHGKEEWPEKNLELLYSYQISGKGFNEEGKFVGIINPEESKEDVAEDIAEFVSYIIK